MKYFQFAVLLVFNISLTLSAACAEAEPEMMNGYAQDTLQNIEIKKMSAEEDDFYAGTEIVPLQKTLSTDESMREDSSDLSVTTKQAFAELKCDNPRLKEQIEHFIYKNINKNETNSVIEKRRRLLLVRNLQNFEEVKVEQIDDKQDFETMAALAYMKINKHIEINKICRSVQNENDNQDSKFKNIYAILYVVAGYYKVVVTNLMPVTEKMDEATFIFNW